MEKAQIEKITKQEGDEEGGRSSRRGEAFSRGKRADQLGQKADIAKEGITENAPERGTRSGS